MENSIVTIDEVRQIIHQMVSTLLSDVKQLSSQINNLETLCQWAKSKLPVLNEITSSDWIQLLKKREGDIKLKFGGPLVIKYMELKFELQSNVFLNGWLTSFSESFGSGRLRNVVKLLSPDYQRSALVHYNFETRKHFVQKYVGRMLEVEIFRQKDDCAFVAYPLHNFLIRDSSSRYSADSDHYYRRYHFTGSAWSAICNRCPTRYVDLVDTNASEEERYPGNLLLSSGNAIPNPQRRQQLEAKGHRRSVKVVCAVDPEHLVCVRHFEESASIRQQIEACVLEPVVGLPSVGDVVCLDPEPGNPAKRERALVLYRCDPKNYLDLLHLDTGLFMKHSATSDHLKKMPSAVADLRVGVVFCIQAGISPPYSSRHIAKSLWRMILHLVDHSDDDASELSISECLETFSEILEYEVPLYYKSYVLVMVNRLILCKKLPYLYIRNSNFLRNILDSMQSVLENATHLTNKDPFNFFSFSVTILASLISYHDSVLRSWILKDNGERVLKLCLAASSLTGVNHALDFLAENWVGSAEACSLLQDSAMKKFAQPAPRPRDKFVDSCLPKLPRAPVKESSGPVMKCLRDKSLLEPQSNQPPSIPLDGVDEVVQPDLLFFPSLMTAREKGLVRGAVFPLECSDQHALVLGESAERTALGAKLKYQDIIPTMVAMLNSGLGGTIHLGVDPVNRILCGVQILDDEEDKFRLGFDRMTSVIEPRPLPTLFRVVFTRLAENTRQPLNMMKKVEARLPSASAAGSLCNRHKDGYYLIDIIIAPQRSIVYVYEELLCCVRRGCRDIPLSPNEARQLVAAMVADDSVYANECVFYQSQIETLEKEIAHLEAGLPISH